MKIVEKIGFYKTFLLFFAALSVFVFYLIETPEVVLECIPEPALNIDKITERELRGVNIDYPHGFGKIVISFSILATLGLYIFKIFSKKISFSVIMLVLLYVSTAQILNPSISGCNDRRYPIPDIPLLYCLIILVIVAGIISFLIKRIKTDNF